MNKIRIDGKDFTPYCYLGREVNTMSDPGVTGRFFIPLLSGTHYGILDFLETALGAPTDGMMYLITKIRVRTILQSADSFQVEKFNFVTEGAVSWASANLDMNAFNAFGSICDDEFMMFQPYQGPYHCTGKIVGETNFILERTFEFNKKLISQAMKAINSEKTFEVIPCLFVQGIDNVVVSQVNLIYFEAITVPKQGSSIQEFVS